MTHGSPWPGAWHGTVAGADVLAGPIDRFPEPLPPHGAGDLIDAGRRAGETLRLFLRRRAVLRHLVAQRLGVGAASVALGYDKRGAPVVRLPRPRSPDDRLWISVSAREGATAFALAERPVGIDLEPLAEPGPIAAVLTARERREIQASAEEDRVVMVLQHWTAKEAYLKAIGTGLSRDPAGIEIRAAADDGTFEVRDAERAARGRGAWVTLAGGEPRPFVVAVWSARL